MKSGLLIINLGTPNNADKSAVRAFLRQFLTDKRVINLPAIIRYPLVYALILPLRLRKTCAAYQRIATNQGLPLYIHSQNLVKKLQQRLAPVCTVALSMRYGQLAIDKALSELKDCDHLTVLPLYPQYSQAATGSSIAELMRILQQQAFIPSLTIINQFYQHSAFINACARNIQPYLQNHDYLLFSYHGLPEAHVRELGCQKLCEQDCMPIFEENRHCYRAQCYQTSRLLAKALNISTGRFATVFQSRLGKTPWIRPQIDAILPDLATKGIKRLLIACPSFVADCLETLEEIGISLRARWLSLNGDELTLVPALNADDHWVEALIEIANIEQSEKIVS